jgi:hypothetical protein
VSAYEPPTMGGTNVIKLKTLGIGLCAIGLTAFVSGCYTAEKKAKEESLAAPINCATADGDIRALEQEKKTTTQKIAAGVRSIVPIGLVAGVASGQAGTKYQIATGQYNDMLDKKIAEIKQQCPNATGE